MKKRAALIVLSLILLCLGFILRENFYVSLILYIASFLLCGFPVLKEAIENIIHGEVFDECFLMTIASVGAFSIGAYPEGAAIMLFYQVGELLCDIASDKSRASISSLAEMRADEAFLKRDNDIEKVHASEVQLGDIIVVSAGQKVPLDGVIVSGSTSFDTSSLTGEPLPRDAAVGDKAISGFINLSGTVEIKTESTYETSTVSKILQLIEENADKKSSTERFITRFSKKYTPAVVIIAVLLALILPIFGMSFKDSIYRALSFLVVSCPCALLISVPCAFFGGLGSASKHGILIKNSNTLDLLSRADKAVFDKTGTLTSGKFDLRRVHAEGMTQKELFALCVCAEYYSSHPIAVYLREAYGKEPSGYDIKDTKEIAGHGVVANINDMRVAVGNGKLMDMEGAKYEDISGGCILHVSVDGKYAGYLMLCDTVRPESQNTIKELKTLGIKECAMLTGDTAATAKDVSCEIGLDSFKAELLPHEKTAEIEKMIGGAPLIFVGDGINDAPSIARADIGAAMGALGSEAAIEAADVVLMNDNPAKLPKAVKIARRAVLIAKENIFVSLFIKFLIMILCGVFGLPLALAVFADVGVCVIAILNSLRTLNL